MPTKRSMKLLTSNFARLGTICLFALLASFNTQAQNNRTSTVALQLFAKSEVDRSRGCSVALWHSARDPHRDKFAYLFFERLKDSNHNRHPAMIKINGQKISLQRIASGGKNNGYKLFQYQLYRMPRAGNYVVLELNLEPEEGEAVEVSGGTLSVFMHGKKPFRTSVKGGAGCMTPAAAPQTRAPAVPQMRAPAGRTASRQPARATFPGCARPAGKIEKLICADTYLVSLNLQIKTVLDRFRTGPKRELPEWLQMEYGHHMIAMEECNGKFRCYEQTLRDHIKQVNGNFLRRKARSLTKYTRVRFKLHQSLDSPGNDLIPSKSPRNFGWSQRLCQLRCAATARCAAVGYDPLQQRNNVYGYCTMKSRVTLPLRKWRQHGVLLVKQ